MENTIVSEPETGNQTIRIALVGECMIELQDIPGQGVRQSFGGDTLNTAIYMARLGRNLSLSVDYVTALGTDPFSQAMMAFWETEHVGSSMVQCVSGKLPGLYYIQLDHKGERSFYYWRGESAARRCFETRGSDLILERLSGYDAVYLSGISLAILESASLRRFMDTLEAVRGLGKKIYFDCNYRPELWFSEQAAKDCCGHVFSLAHTVLMNRDEGRSLLGVQDVEAMHRSLAEAGVRESVIRDGVDPCTVFSGGALHRVAAQERVAVVDTTAAGDSFSAAYLVGRMFGRGAEEAAVLGHRLAASVISRKGAVVPLQAMPFPEGLPAA